MQHLPSVAIKESEIAVDMYWIIWMQWWYKVWNLEVACAQKHDSISDECLARACLIIYQLVNKAVYKISRTQSHTCLYLCFLIVSFLFAIGFKKQLKYSLTFIRDLRPHAPGWAHQKKEGANYAKGWTTYRKFKRDDDDFLDVVRARAFTLAALRIWSLRGAWAALLWWSFLLYWSGWSFSNEWVCPWEGWVCWGCLCWLASLLSGWCNGCFLYTSQKSDQNCL